MPDTLLNNVVEVAQLLLPLTLPSIKKTLDSVPTTLLFLLVDGSPVIKNVKAFEKAAAHQPGGGSLRTISHYVQFFDTHSFQKYQFQDPLENLRLYRHARPKNYTVKNFGSSQLILLGADDSLVVPSVNIILTLLTAKQNF